MFASVPSAVLFCAEGHLIHVEVQVSAGLPGFSLVGLPDASIRESRDRARAAVLSSGLPWPKHKITVNLAPSGDRKAGSGLDLAIAVGVLAASAVIPAEAIEATAFIGELGLDGSLRPVNGVAPMVGAVGERDVVVPIASATEANVVALGRVRLVANLAELVLALRGEAPWPDHDVVERVEMARRPRPISRTCRVSPSPDTRWRSPQPAAITSCSSGRRAPARRCWRRGCPVCSRRSNAIAPSRSR